VKEDIADWLSILREKEISDWLVVVVVSDDNRVKSKILRNSVYDRVKHDFCGRCPDRFVAMITLCQLDDIKLYDRVKYDFCCRCPDRFVAMITLCQFDVIKFVNHFLQLFCAF